MQGTKTAGGDLIHERSPFFFDEMGDRAFISRESGRRNQGFKKWENIGHQNLISE
jgi:hypothetical protein